MWLTVAGPAGLTSGLVVRLFCHTVKLTLIFVFLHILFLLFYRVGYY